MLNFQVGNERALQLTTAKIAHQIERNSQPLICNPGLWVRNTFFFILETNTVL